MLPFYITLYIVARSNGRLSARIADRDDLGVGGGIVGGRHAVAAAAHDFAATHDHAAKRPASARTHAIFGQLDGFSHEGCLAHGCFSYIVFNVQIEFIQDPPLVSE